MLEEHMLNFSLPEKVFILAINDRSNKITSSAQYAIRFVLAGALLSDLTITGKIQLLKNKLTLINTDPGGIALFDETIAMIAAEKKPRKLKHWIERLSTKQIEKQVAARLDERHVIQIEKKHFLWVIPYEVYPEIDASAKYWIKQQLRGIVLAGAKAEPADIILLSLLKGSGLLSLVFTRDERKQASSVVNTLVKNEVFGETVAEVLADIETTMITAVTAATAYS